MAQTDDFAAAWAATVAEVRGRGTWARRLRWWASAKLQVVSWRIGRAAARLAR